MIHVMEFAVIFLTGAIAGGITYGLGWHAAKKAYDSRHTEPPRQSLRDLMGFPEQATIIETGNILDQVELE